MRWDDLFADLEAQADALELAGRACEVSERARIEFGAIGMAERLLPAVGSHLRVELLGGLAVAGTVLRAGVDWLLVDEGAGREAVLSLTAVRTVHGLGRLSAVPGSQGAVSARLTVRGALRGIAHDRSAVRVHLRDGAVLDATIDRVGADFVEIARHAAHEARRRNEVREVVLIPVAALAAVRRASG
jgi:molybdopterin-binding protein